MSLSESNKGEKTKMSGHGGWLTGGFLKVHSKNKQQRWRQREKILRMTLRFKEESASCFVKRQRKRGILCELPLNLSFISLQIYGICNEIIHMMFHSTLTSNPPLWDWIITCGEARVVRKTPRYESQTAELLLFSTDKCWKVFLCLWKWNVKNDNTFQKKREVKLCCFSHQGKQHLT